MNELIIQSNTCSVYQPTLGATPPMTVSVEQVNGTSPMGGSPIPGMLASPNQPSLNNFMQVSSSCKDEDNLGAVSKKCSEDSSPIHEAKEDNQEQTDQKEVSCSELFTCQFESSDSDNQTSDDESIDSQQAENFEGFLSSQASLYLMEMLVCNSITEGNVESLKNHLLYNDVADFDINTITKNGEDVRTSLSLALEYEQWKVLDFLLKDPVINIYTDFSTSVYEKYKRNETDTDFSAMSNLVKTLIDQSRLMRSPYIVWFVLNKYFDMELDRDVLDDINKNIEYKYQYYASFMEEIFISLNQKNN